ncbi:hypothetical protein [Aliiroseovarius sp. S253]|uniref:hypothetical protein n=1 Tax=Aliiroseovarius sp. S253 TaxID=3415133 RepID=UPI003C7E4329
MISDSTAIMLVLAIFAFTIWRSLAHAKRPEYDILRDAGLRHKTGGFLFIDALFRKKSDPLRAPEMKLAKHWLKQTSCAMAASFLIVVLTI